MDNQTKRDAIIGAASVLRSYTALDADKDAATSFLLSLHSGDATLGDIERYAALARQIAVR